MESTPILTTDGGNNFASGIMAGATLNRGNDATALMASQFGNNWMNNPFAYMMFMALFRDGAFGGNGNAAANMQLQNLQTQIADNHNSDLAMQAVQGNQNAINQLAQNLGLGIGQVTQAVSTVRDAITAANGNIQLAAQQMIANNNLQSAALGQQLCQGFNGVQREILTQGYQGQLATQAQGYEGQLNNLRQSGLMQQLSQQQSQLVSNGFTQIGFQIERQGCEIKEAQLANTQRLMDMLSGHWSQQDQSRISSLESQLALSQQTQTILAQLNSANATATKASA